MPLTPIFHPQEDWYQAMVTKNKGSLKATNRQEEWYEEIVDSMSSGGSGGGVLVVGVTVDGNTMTLDKTWQDIYECDIPVCNSRDESYIDFDSCKITHAEYDPINQYYYVNILVNKDSDTGSYQDSIMLTTPTANGYPSLTRG